MKITENIFWQINNPSICLTKMALHSFRTEKQFKIIFFTDNDEEAFNLVFLKVYLDS